MYIILLSMLPFLMALAFMLYQAFRRVDCPDCGDPASAVLLAVQENSSDVARG